MIHKKNKGSNAERELIHLFWNNDWAAMRAAGSGSTRFPSPDVIASNNLRKLAVECKSTSGVNQYFKEKEIAELEKFSRMFGAEPWVAIRFDNEGWYFFSLEDLRKTESQFSMSLRDAKSIGLTFEELINL